MNHQDCNCCQDAHSASSVEHNWHGQEDDKQGNHAVYRLPSFAFAEALSDVDMCTRQWDHLQNPSALVHAQQVALMDRPRRLDNLILHKVFKFIECRNNMWSTAIAYPQHLHPRESQNGSQLPQQHVWWPIEDHRYCEMRLWIIGSASMMWLWKTSCHQRLLRPSKISCRQS